MYLCFLVTVTSDGVFSIFDAVFTNDLVDTNSAAYLELEAEVRIQVSPQPTLNTVYDPLRFYHKNGSTTGCFDHCMLNTVCMCGARSLTGDCRVCGNKQRQCQQCRV